MNAPLPDAAGLARSPTLGDVIGRVRAQWILVLSVTLAIVLVVGLWSILAAPRYESTAVLRIMEQQPKLQLAEELSSMPAADVFGFGQDEFETELGVVRSFRIAAAAVDSLALTVQVERPRGLRSRVLRVLRVGDTDREATIELRAVSEGVYEGEVDEPDADDVSLGPIRVGEAFGHAGYLVSLVPPADSLPDKIRIRLAPRFEVIDDLREDVDIRRQAGGARLVEVTYVSHDRELGASVVNGIVDEYVEYKTRVERSDARFTAAELRHQVATQADSLVQAEEKLRRYQEVHKIVAPEAEAEQQVRRLAALKLQEDALLVERQALAELVEIVRSRVASGSPADGGSGYRQLITYPTLIDNQAIQEILVALLELENERSSLLVQRTGDNRDVGQLTDRINEIDQQLFDMGVDYLEGLDGQIASVRAGVARLERELEALPRREMEYLRLYRDRTVLNEGYLLLQQQLRLAEVEDAIKNEGVRVVDVAQVAHEDDVEYPKPLVNVFLALVGGLAIGIATALVREPRTA